MSIYNGNSSTTDAGSFPVIFPAQRNPLPPRSEHHFGKIVVVIDPASETYYMDLQEGYTPENLWDAKALIAENGLEVMEEEECTPELSGIYNQMVRVWLCEQNPI